jgi:hypothetical protein
MHPPTHTADPIPTLQVCDFGPGAFRAPAWSARSEVRSFSAPGLKAGRLGPPAWKPHVMSRFADIRPLLCVLVAILAASCAAWATPAAAARDLDRDGVPNSRDRNVDGDAFQNAHDTDIDGDGARNGHDRDVDGDGVPNRRDRDIDGDGAPNRRDSDMDCDRVPNRFDRDIDGDGLRNARDPDSDTDGVSSVARLRRRVRLQRSFFGIVAPHAHAVEGVARRTQLEAIRNTGVGMLRQNFEWALIETRPGVLDFHAYDSFVGDTAREGLSILPVLTNPPAWRSVRPAQGAQRGTYPPRSAVEFAIFAGALVKRYGPGGSFWAAHPSIPRRPIRAWQVWNEPHLRAYWPGGPDPAAYTAMLRLVSRGIRAADPGAEVVTAAISQSNQGIPLARFIRGMYQAGAKGSFNTLAINPYAPAADQVYKIMRGVRRIANRAGDPGAGLRVTELGWATAGPRSPFRVGYRDQGELIKRTWATLVKQRKRLRLRGLVYYSWRDTPPYIPVTRDFYGLHTGLLERDGRSKPGRARFSKTVRGMIAR